MFSSNLFSFSYFTFHCILSLPSVCSLLCPFPSLLPLLYCSFLLHHVTCLPSSSCLHVLFPLSCSFILLCSVLYLSTCVDSYHCFPSVVASSFLLTLLLLLLALCSRCVLLLPTSLVAVGGWKRSGVLVSC